MTRPQIIRIQSAVCNLQLFKILITCYIPGTLTIVEVLWRFFHPVCPPKELHPYCLSRRILRDVIPTAVKLLLQFSALQPSLSLNFFTTWNVIISNARITTRKKSTLRLCHRLLHRQITNGGRERSCDSA